MAKKRKREYVEMKRKWAEKHRHCKDGACEWNNRKCIEVQKKVIKKFAEIKYDPKDHTLRIDLCAYTE